MCCIEKCSHVILGQAAKAVPFLGCLATTPSTARPLVICLGLMGVVIQQPSEGTTLVVSVLDVKDWLLGQFFLYLICKVFPTPF